jgi:hypothetical protein
MKLDVEGAEIEVLRGATRTLERWCPHLILEYHAEAWAAAGVTLDDLYRFLGDGDGYELRRLTGDDTLCDIEAIPPAQLRRRLVPWLR